MPNVTPDDVRAFVRRKQEALSKNRKELHARAQQDADRILSMIIEKYQPTRVIQWVSVLHPEAFVGTVGGPAA